MGISSQLKTQGKLEAAADTEIAVGTYDQFRMEISKVVIVDTGGEHEAKLPSNELKVNADLEVNENSTATATFDFIADESLHVTGNGLYILAPVVQVETREDAEVEINSDNSVEISGGNVKTNTKIGMDADGNVGVGVKIPADVNVTSS